MMRSRWILGFTALSIVACGSDKPPGSQSGNPDVTLLDITLVDRVTPADTATGDGTVADAPTDVLRTDAGMDATRADVTDVPDAPDVNTSVPGLCQWSYGDLAGFAVRMALCASQPAQNALNTYFSPENWEGGSLALRACPSLRCVADMTSPGTCATWLGACLKYDITPAPDAGCATPAASCEGTPPTTYRQCRDGVEVRDNCMALGRRCVAAGGEAACVPNAGDACAAGAPMRCNGNVLEACVLGTYTPMRNCTVTAGVCDATAGTCRGAGAECTGNAVDCDGTQLRECRGGRWHTIDCGRLLTGATCQTVNGHSFCGVDRECDPTVAAASGACDANTLVLCAGGRTYRYACEARNGFSRCETGRGCVN